MNGAMWDMECLRIPAEECSVKHRLRDIGGGFLEGADGGVAIRVAIMPPERYANHVASVQQLIVLPPCCES